MNKLKFLIRKYVGLQNSRKRQNSRTSFFSFPNSCQIPNLSFYYETVFGHEPGFLIEIGAYDGITFSNSSGLIDKGWYAKLYEPVMEHYQLCAERYEGNDRVEVFPFAVSSKKGTLLMNLAGPLTTTNTKLLDRYREIPWASNSVSDTSVEVTAVTLGMIIQQVNGHLDLLIVDVEGHELEVFHDFENIEKYPRMIIVEIANWHPDLQLFSIEANTVQDKITKCGYSIIFKDSINTIFLKNSEC